MKFVSPGRVGVPDRLLLLSDGTHVFIELKATNGKLSSAQVREMERYSHCSHVCFVLDSYSSVDECVSFLENTNLGLLRSVSRAQLAHYSWTWALVKRYALLP